jgi:hypothetical protein
VYAGVEVEVNQARLGSRTAIDAAGRILAESLVEALARRS